MIKNKAQNLITTVHLITFNSVHNNRLCVRCSNIREETQSNAILSEQHLMASGRQSFFIKEPEVQTKITDM